MKLPVMVDIDVEDLANNLPEEEAMTLIKEIDLGQADWDFTLEITKHFVKLVMEADLEFEYKDWLKELVEC